MSKPQDLTGIDMDGGNRSPVVTIDDVRDAAERLRGVANRTPVLTSRTLDERVGAAVFVKAEVFQRGGAFKFRGAFNRIASLPEDSLARGVAAYSSGNHAQAVALAARELGTRAVILMPSDAPPSKVEATRAYGAEVVTYDRYTGDRQELGEALARDRGMTLIPPYDDELVMAGQGTIALEFLEEVNQLDHLVVPVSGGGLIAGCATVAKALLPSIRMVGVEPESGDDTRRSLEEGRRVAIDVPRTIADGLQVDMPGHLTFEVNRHLVDEVVTVTDAMLLDAMILLFERMKVAVEPSGAAGVAALLSGRLTAPGGRVGVVLSGGNVSADRFADLVRTHRSDD